MHVLHWPDINAPLLTKLIQEHSGCNNDNPLHLQTQIPSGSAIYVDLTLECLGNHTQLLSISLTWGTLGNVSWHAVTNFPLPSRCLWESFQSARMFSWQFPWYSSSLSSVPTSANVSTAGRAAYACTFRVIAAVNRLRVWRIQKTKELSNCSHWCLSHTHSSPFSCGSSGDNMKDTCRPLWQKRAIYLWMTLSVITSTQKSYQWDFSIKHYLWWLSSL